MADSASKPLKALGVTAQRGGLQLTMGNGVPEPKDTVRKLLHLGVDVQVKQLLQEQIQIRRQARLRPISDRREKYDSKDQGLQSCALLQQVLLRGGH
jgi:hypothetical protein